MVRKVLHGRFIVQSNVMGPDGLIQRINNFLEEWKNEKISKITEDEVETSKKALIKILEQKDLKLSDEVGRLWGAISDENGLYEFDRKQKKIEATKNVSV